MATDGERNRKLRAERSAQLRRLPRLQKETLARIAALLAEAQTRIAARLAAAPSEFDAFILPQLQEQVRQAMAALEAGGAAALTEGASLAWRAGIDLVDAPIEAGLQLDRPALRISALVPSIDTAQLRASQAFLTGKIRDISATAAARIDTELGLAVIGQQTPQQAATTIARLLGDTARARASTLVRTEIGRVYSVATQERMAQAQAVLPGLKKQWRRSGRIRSRLNHDAADSQVRDVDQPFDVGAGVKLRYPRDPQGPARETINCGCVQLPFMESWEMSQPGRQAFSEREIRLDPRKRDLADALGQ